MEKDTSPERLIGYVFDLTTNLGESQNLVIKGNLALSASKEEMGMEFDKLIAVTDRLAAKHKVAKKKSDIAADEAMIKAMKDDLALLDEGVKEKYKGRPLPTAEQNNREAMVRNIRHLEGRVAGYREDLKGLEKEAQ